MSAPKLATYDDLLATPEDAIAEVLGGEVVFQPSPTFGHGRAQGGLSNFIGGPFDYGRGGPGGWWIVPEIDVRFTPHDITRPDLAGWRRTRLPEPPERPPTDVVPDWICEILSPSTEKRDRVYKQQLHARHGVQHYWLVHPVERFLQAHALEAGRWVTVATLDDRAVARIPPFEAVELRVGDLFFPQHAG